MVFRFTLTNDIVGSQVIDNPDGWDEIKAKLDRDPKFHSLIEKIEVPLIFYGSNGVVDGGYDYITNVLTTQGFNAIIVLLIEVSDDEENTFETFYEGNLELSDKERLSEGETFYKCKVPIIQTDVWSKFWNRFDTPVDVQSGTDLDGESVEVVEPIELTLSSQTIKQTFQRKTDYNDNNEGLFLVDSGISVTRQSSGSEPADPSAYLIFGNDYNLLDEITERFEYGTQIAGLSPTEDLKYLFKIKFAGEYRIYGRIRYALIFDQSDPNKSVMWFYQVKQNGTLQSAVQIGTTDTITSGTTMTDTIGNQLNYDVTIDLSAGDEIYFYAELRIWDVVAAGVVVTSYFSDYDSNFGAPFVPVYTNFTIVSQTTYPNTTTDALLIHDVFKSITERITGIPDSFYSEILGRIDHGYAENGCNSAYALMKGLHVRGFSFADKPFFQSAKDAWEGADPIFNLGLGYEDLDQSPFERVIRIEEKAYFYNEEISVYLDNVDDIKETYDKNFIFKSVNVGYQKWSAESASGIDDPQTKKTYATLFEQIGTASTIFSKFFAAALAIEQARRNRVEQTKDYRLDEDTMIIAIGIVDSPQDYYPELDERFISVTGINNPHSRYNLRITPAWNFLRWINYFKGCLQDYTDSDFRFTQGEGNYDMVSVLDPESDCILTDATPLEEIDEGGDIPVSISSDYLHLADQWEFSFKLTWEQYKTIRNNRNKAIGVSQTDADHRTCFINSLEWNPNDSMATFKVWLK